MNKNKIKEILGLGTILIAWIILLYVSYLQLYPFEPLVINDVTLMSERVTQGGNVLVHIDVCKNCDYPATVSKYLKDGLVYALPSVVTNSEQGCKRYTSVTHIPENLPKGVYKLHVVYTYHIGFRDIRVEYTTEEFEVLKHE